MSSDRFQIRLAPITSGLFRRGPKILLGGNDRQSLMHCLRGWPSRWGRKDSSLIQFACDPETIIADFPADSFDLAVLEAPSANAEEVIHELTRVARQGLITRRG